METPRYDVNHGLFIIGLLSLVTSLALIVFSLYLLPFLLWGWHYNVPEFISFWVNHYVEQHKFTPYGASIFVFLHFFIPGLLAGFIAYLCSNRIDDTIYGLHQSSSGSILSSGLRSETRESLGLGLKILILLLLVILGAGIIEWLIHLTLIF